MTERRFPEAVAALSVDADRAATTAKRLFDGMLVRARAGDHACSFYLLRMWGGADMSFDAILGRPVPIGWRGLNSPNKCRD